MSVHFLKVATAVAAIAAFSAAGFADEAADQANPDTKALLEYVKKLEGRVNQLESEKEWPLDQVRSQSGSALESAVRSINLSGYMEFQYNWNFRHGGRNANRGDTLDFNTGHASANDENSFSFQNLQLLADKPLTTVNSTGFRVRAQYGRVAQFDNRDATFNGGVGREVIGGEEEIPTSPGYPFDTGGSTKALGSTSVFTGFGTAFDVREAYMSWRMETKWGSMDHMDLSIGKFDTPLGFETPDNTTNWQVTRGPFQAYLLPVTHTGLRAVMPWSDCCKTTIYVVNGWDNVNDSADGKTIIASQEFGKFDWMNSSITVNVSYGNEGSIGPGLTTVAPDGNKTTLVEAIWRGEMDKDTHMAADFIWARGQNGANDSRGGIQTREVYGAEGYIRNQWSKDTWVSARGGYYVDNGFDSLLVQNLRVWDLTLTAGWDVAQDMTLALEYRHDQAIGTTPFSNKSGGGAHSQDTVTASAVYRF